MKEYKVSEELKRVAQRERFDTIKPKCWFCRTKFERYGYNNLQCPNCNIDYVQSIDDDNYYPFVSETEEFSSKPKWKEIYEIYREEKGKDRQRMASRSGKTLHPTVHSQCSDKERSPETV